VDGPPVAAPATQQPAPGNPSDFWTVPALCEAYGWPFGLAGGGVIGIIAMGGGYVRSDIETFFKSINQPVPDIVDVSLGGFGNSPNQPHGPEFDPDVEAALDIEVAGASYYVATGKRASIRVYWTGPDLRSIAPAIYKAAADGCAVFSISWGASEDVWAWMHRQIGQNIAVQLEAALITAAAAGMTVFAASGDREANDGMGHPVVTLPAACPHAVGCGGTRKTRKEETVWNSDPNDPNGFGTGGGFSNLFLPQSWTVGAPVGPGRIVPDISANADKQTGYHIYVHGEDRVTGGTSAVAPLIAGLFAAFGKGRGFVNSTLWNNRTCFEDVTKGDNDGFEAGKGPDACSGLGAPIGHALARLFRAAPRAKRAYV
jgi:subtilase family serine protease